MEFSSQHGRYKLWLSYSKIIKWFAKCVKWVARCVYSYLLVIDSFHISQLTNHFSYLTNGYRHLANRYTHLAIVLSCQSYLLAIHNWSVPWGIPYSFAMLTFNMNSYLAAIVLASTLGTSFLLLKWAWASLPSPSFQYAQRFSVHDPYTWVLPLICTANKKWLSTTNYHL